MRVWWLVFLVGCVESSSVLCGTSQLCPSGTTCIHLSSPDEDICATEEQIDACAMAADGDSCTLRDGPPSWCHDRACIPIVCGNNRLDATEVCDDGNTQSGDRTCSADCSSNEQCGNGSVDPLVYLDDELSANEECDDGNAMSGDGCSSSCVTELPRWSRFSEVPVPQTGSAIAYDPVRKRVVMFGGLTGSTAGTESSNGFFEWNGSNWASIPAAIRPSPRAFASMVYDTARRKLVLFGGYGGESDAPAGDLWEWDGTTWALLRPVPTPSPRSHATMVYDAARKKTVLFGGFAAPTAVGVGNTAPNDETWEWDGTTWTQNTAALHPAARFTHVMAYDPVRAVIVMAGGYDIEDGNVVTRRETWEYNGTWTQVPVAAPPELDSKSTLAYDPNQARMIAYGGIQPDTNTISSKTWSYNGAQWIDLAQATPATRHGASLVADLGKRELVLFGGDTNDRTFVDTVWRWNGTGWSMPISPFVPPRRGAGTAAFDPTTGVTWVFGSTGTGSNRLLMFDGSVWQLHPAIGPSSRFTPGLAFDPLRRELVLFGGTTSQTPNNDTWTFDGTAWTPRTPATSPAPRFAPMMWFDHNRKRVVMFSGAASVDDEELWEWTGTTWQPIAASPLPPERAYGSVAVDAARGVCVLFSGSQPPDGTALDDTWHFDGTTWTLANASSPLPDRINTPLAYHAPRRVDVVFGGSAGGTTFADTWQWDGTAWQQLEIDQSPPGRSGHLLFPAADGNGVVTFSGFVTATEVPIVGGDTWRLRYESSSRAEQCALAVDDDEDGLSGCDDPDCWARCSPMCPPGAASCPPDFPHCGDNTCNAALENCRNCPGDCATCDTICGDGFCDSTETLATCEGDCTP